MSTETLFTPAYFREELLRFREAFGNRAIMKDRDKRDRAFKGFTLVYLQIQGTTEEMADCAMHFQSTAAEFERRCLYMDMKLCPANTFAHDFGPRLQANA